MPIIKIYSPNPSPKKNLLSDICNGVTEVLNLPYGHAWAFWHQVDQQHFHKPGWEDTNPSNAPMIMLYCKNSYSELQIKEIIDTICKIIIGVCNCKKESIYISCFRIKPGHLMVRGELWLDN